VKIAIFLSGRGSNFKSILNAIDKKQLDATVGLVISNNSSAEGLHFAQYLGIPTAIFDRAEYSDGAEFGRQMLETLQRERIELIALAGYLRKIPPVVIRAFPNRIVNIHPALLPKHGGKGMFGHFVHEAVIRAGDAESGVTVHYVDEVYDRGAVVAQRSIPVLSNETPESLAARILQVEHEFYPEVLQRLVQELSFGRKMADNHTPVTIKRALFSCFRKPQAVALAEQLHQLGVAIVASGGTADAIAKFGIPVERIAAKTGFDDLLQGRVKTLHPAVYAAILSRRDSAADLEDLKKVDVEPVDLVVVDLYPFTDQDSDARKNHSPVELIDIGGVALIRAAAKNFDRVLVAARAEQFAEIGELLNTQAGAATIEQRKLYAAKALQWTSFYDGCIAGWLEDEAASTPEVCGLPLNADLDLRYGENPHQPAKFYTIGGNKAGVAAAEILGGKQLSFNNLLDLDIALRLPREFNSPTVAILKHTTPCGVGQGLTPAEAYSNARSTDPQSAYGGIAGFNCTVDLGAAKILREGFMEVIAAPDYTEDALKELHKSKNLRIIKLPGDRPSVGSDIRSVWGGLLVQQIDAGFPEFDELKIVTKLQPTPEQLDALKFAWVIVRYIKSNAILIAEPGRTVGIGAGQMSRVDAAHIAVWKAGQAGLSTKGTVAASDAYFPFRDGLDLLVDAGITAVIQPGGSVRDEEVIAAADERGVTMLFTGRRHFRH